jgi:hypothetical protein
MPMSHDKAEDPATEPGWLPARASDLQQEPAIPEDVVWPLGAEKPAPALPENAEKKAAKKAPAKKAAAKPDKAEKRPAAKADVETRVKPATKKS